MELLQEIFKVIVYTLITGCGAIIVKKIVDFVNAKINELQEKTKLSQYENLNKIIDRVQETVETIVTTVNQVFVDSLKASGSFTKESATEAKNMALEMANKLINEEAANAIETVYGDVNVYIDTLIEKLVNNLKN